jgi:Mn-dependent DtxR family transcriptional regulator
MQALKRRGFVEIDGRFAQITETGKRKAKELKKIFDEL